MSSPPVLASSARVAADIFAREGAAGLWAGLGATVVRVFFGAGVYFASLHALADAAGPGPLASFAAGAGGPGAGAAPRGPAAEARAFFALAKAEGHASLFSGLVPTLVRDAPFSGLYVAAFRALRGDARADAAVEDAWRRHARIFFAGVGAGALATAATHPADVLKTRLQLRPAGGRFVDGAVLVAEARALVRAQGARGLYVGFGARVAKRTLSTALTWTLFEEGMRER